MADDRRLVCRAECPLPERLGRLRLGPRLGLCTPGEDQFAASRRGESEERQAEQQRVPDQLALLEMQRQARPEQRELPAAGRK